MDWKYKHFHQERSFAVPRDTVIDTARQYMTEVLGWKVADSAEGLTAEGYSFMHAAIADFHFAQFGNETKVIIDLRVERAGGAGFMLFDVGGYYGIQIRKWFDAIQWHLHQTQTDQSQISQRRSPVPAPPSRGRAGACLFNGVLGFIAVMFGLWMVITVIEAVWGLATGNLYLLARGGTIAVHGVLARIVSVLILITATWVLWQLKHKRHHTI